MSTPQFDPYLLHLPPINLHTIRLLYRHRDEYQSSLTEIAVESRARSYTPRPDIDATLQILLKTR